MTNKTKIIIAILVIVAVGITIFGIVSNNKTDNTTNKKQDEIDNMLEFFNETDEENTQINNTEIENNIENATNATNQDNQADKETQNNNVVVGKEEQESNNENTEIDNKQKAIELAKKEWAISVDSYDFQVSDEKNDGTYDVTVISNDANRTTVAIYNVNVKTEIVKDITE